MKGSLKALHPFVACCSGSGSRQKGEAFSVGVLLAGVDVLRNTIRYRGWYVIRMLVTRLPAKSYSIYHLNCGSFSDVNSGNSGQKKKQEEKVHFPPIHTAIRGAKECHPSGARVGSWAGNAAAGWCETPLMSIICQLIIFYLILITKKNIIFLPPQRVCTVRRSATHFAFCLNSKDRLLVCAPVDGKAYGMSINYAATQELQLGPFWPFRTVFFL